MTQQFICDECGLPIDTLVPHYQLSGSKVQVIDDVLTSVDKPVTLHYHEAHLPVYKIEGVPVEITGEPVPIPAPPGVPEAG